MRKLLMVLLCLLLSPSLFGQSAFAIFKLVAKNSVKRGTLVCRTIKTLPKNAKLATKAALYQSPDDFVRAAERECELVITTKFVQPVLTAPENIYGGYNYLRVISKISKEKGAVVKAYRPIWKKINDVTSYNGAHHIVNQSTLKEIHKRYGMSVNLSDMQRNAPAVFHRLHGHPAYTKMFHNAEFQVLIYERSGIHGILDNFFRQAKLISVQSSGAIPMYDYHVVKGTYLEAELWAKTFGLKW